MDQSRTALNRAFTELRDVTRCTAHVGVELEFYLSSSDRRAHSGVIGLATREIERAAIGVFSVREEVGDGQYEVSLGPYDDPVALVSALERCKASISAISQADGCPASFGPRPDPTQPPSSAPYTRKPV